MRVVDRVHLFVGFFARQLMTLLHSGINILPL